MTKYMKQISQALLKAQVEFPTIKKEDSNPFFKSKYAGLPSILETVLPILQKHNLLLTQVPITNGDRIGVKTAIIHTESGELIEGDFTMGLAKNDPQGAGSAITYARRYALISILGLNVDDDTDAEEAMGRGKNYPQSKIIAQIKKVNYDDDI